MPRTRANRRQTQYFDMSDDEGRRTANPSPTPAPTPAAQPAAAATNITANDLASMLESMQQSQTELIDLLFTKMLDAQQSRRSSEPPPQTPTPPACVPGNFASCRARYSGACDEPLDAFIDAVEAFKECASVSDVNALRGLSMLLTHDAATWWQGVKDTVTSWNQALLCLRSAFGDSRPPHRVYRDLFANPQARDEKTEIFISRARALLARIPRGDLSCKVQLDITYGLLHLRVRERLRREEVDSFDSLIRKVREIEEAADEGENGTYHQPTRRVTQGQRGCPAASARAAGTDPSVPPPSEYPAARSPPTASGGAPRPAPRSTRGSMPAASFTPSNGGPGATTGMMSMKNKFCVYCKTHGHVRDECRKLLNKGDSNNTSDTNTVSCYGCGAKGVIRSQCQACSQRLSFSAIDADTLSYHTPNSNDCVVNCLTDSNYCSCDLCNDVYSYKDNDIDKVNDPSYTPTFPHETTLSTLAVNFAPLIQRPIHDQSHAPLIQRPTHDQSRDPLIQRPTHDQSRNSRMQRPTHDQSRNSRIQRPTHDQSHKPTHSNDQSFNHAFAHADPGATVMPRSHLYPTGMPRCDVLSLKGTRKVTKYPCLTKGDRVNAPPVAASHFTTAGRPILCVEILGSRGTALVDTAAKCCVAGHALYQYLKQKKQSFTYSKVNVKLADGVIHSREVLVTRLNVSISKAKRVTADFIIFPDANNNETLLGIDFLKAAGIVINFARSCWNFAGEKQCYPLEYEVEEVKTPVPIVSASSIAFQEVGESSHYAAQDRRVFVHRHDLTLHLGGGKASPPPPSRFLSPEQSEGRTEFNTSGLNQKIGLQSEVEVFSISLRDHERSLLSGGQKQRFDDTLRRHEVIFRLGGDAPFAEHYIETGDNLHCAVPPYRLTLSRPVCDEVLAIDLFGPLPVGEAGEKWVLLIEDTATHWIELFALKEATAEACAFLMIEEYFLRYGFLRRIVSDNRVQFISAVMQQCMYILGIRQNLIPFYHPEANPAERKNRDIKVQLAMLVQSEHRRWPKYLAHVRFALNSATCSTTGLTPSYMTYAREMRTPFDAHLDLRAILEKENYVPQVTTYLAKFVSSLQEIRERVEGLQDSRKEAADAQLCSAPEFTEGDLILLTTHALSNTSKGLTRKFMPRRDGPYLIKRVLSPTTYEISDINGEVLGRYHVSDITPFVSSRADDDVRPVQPRKTRGRPRRNRDQTSTHNSTLTTPVTNSLTGRPRELEEESVAPRPSINLNSAPSRSSVLPANESARKPTPPPIGRRQIRRPCRYRDNS